MCLEAYVHQDIPFEKLVEELRPERDLHRNPFFQVFFNMVSVGASGLELLGLKTEPVNIAEPDSKFDLTLYVKEQKSNIELELVYNADLFRQDRMTEMLNQLRHLLLQVTKNPDKSIATYSLVTEASQHLLPDPGIALAEPHQELVMNMFARWVERTPEKEAVSQGEHSWTYAELAERADMLAQELIARGVEKGDVIALCGSRSFGLIAGILGVLLCGGVMLPIDTSLPDRRKQQMLREASAKGLVYVGGRSFEDVWFKESAALNLLCIDAETARVIDDEKRVDLATIPLSKVSPDEPAYIFFTSGTTGVPKGILGCHKGLSHFLNWQSETFDIGPQDRVAQLTNLSFDVVLRDIFLPLTHGATLCLPEEKDIIEPKDILNWLEREQVSVLHTVPALAQCWLDEIPEGVSLDSLRWVFFAGEPLIEILVNRWRAAFPSAETINLYGPTETTMIKCFYQIPPEVFAGVQPLGQPMPQTQALVIANKDRLCGIGEIGEIVIRTPFRSLGYINSPEENQQRFVKNPFRDDETDLIYYTGDLGRYRPDGMLEILGRLDDQVKIHGVRIEPDEVTAVLSRHPAVKACAVVARESEQDQTYLVAYVVSQDQDSIGPSELMSYLSRQLPTAMVPAWYIFLDALPMTPNGKVDRQKLPAPDQVSHEQEEIFVAPRNAMEEVLAGIWIDLLNVERVGVHDNFFKLGGTFPFSHSINISDTQNSSGGTSVAQYVRGAYCSGVNQIN
jgi:amino acid adenylation domain-containing protein